MRTALPLFVSQFTVPDEKTHRRFFVGCKTSDGTGLVLISVEVQGEKKELRELASNGSTPARGKKGPGVGNQHDYSDRTMVGSRGWVLLQCTRT